LRGRPLLTALPVSLALVAGLGAPLAYSIDTANTVHTGASPTAGPALTSAGGAAGRGAFTGAGAGFARDGARGAGDRTGAFGDRGGAFGDRAADGADRRAGVGAAAGFGGLAGGNAAINATLAKLLEDGAVGFKWTAATVGSDEAASMELSTGGDPVMAVGGFSGTDPTPSLAAFEQVVAQHEVHYFVASGTGAAGAGLAGTRGASAEDSAQVTAWVEAHYTAKTVGGTTVYDLTAPAAGS